MVSEAPAVGLSLRSLRPGDEETAVRWGADREFCLANGWTPGLAPRVLRRHWQVIIADRSSDFLRLGIEQRGEGQGGKLVGYVDLGDITAESAEFGIAIGEPRRWGQGTGTRAGQLLLARAFGPLGLSVLRAKVHAPNVRSHALMQRLGFIPVGESGTDLYRGAQVPLVRYEARREDWLRLSKSM